MKATSPFDGFSKLSHNERLNKLANLTGLSPEDVAALSGGESALTVERAEHLIENVIGMFSLPLGVATHFFIDGRDVPIPMAVEETSIIAAASAAAKWVRNNGGFRTRALGNLIIGQVQFPTIRDPEAFTRIVSEHEEELVDLANRDFVPTLVSRGGGVTGIQVRKISRPDGQTMAVVHIFCDPCDAMGANLINQVCEGLKAPLETLTGEKIGLCILSNLVDTKLVEATCEISDIAPHLGKAIEEATLFANLDPYRCSTHNKGVMNAIDPILIATGNDWRAVEAGIHACMAISGSRGYRTITEWEYRGGKLHGRFLAPVAVGTVGGMTRIHPTVKVCLKIIGAENAEQLARVCAAAGLAQNLAALKALCSEGIIKGHMRLHASNLAIAVGAETDEVGQVEELLRQEPRISFSRAREILDYIREKKRKVAGVAAAKLTPDAIQPAPILRD